MPAGDRYTEISLGEMDTFLKRGFRALYPKRSESRGEVYYDLNLSDGQILIRVWTSIRPHNEEGAGVGEDAIRVTLITKNGKPLVPKGKIVMRTKNWRNALQDRIEDLHEAYESKTEYWKNRRQERDEGTTREVVPKPAPKSGDLLEGSWKNNNGDWVAQVPAGAASGDDVMMTTRGGAKKRVTLDQKVKHTNYGDWWTVRKASSNEGTEPPLESIADRIAARYLGQSV